MKPSFFSKKTRSKTNEPDEEAGRGASPTKPAGANDSLSAVLQQVSDDQAMATLVKDKLADLDLGDGVWPVILVTSESGIDWKKPKEKKVSKLIQAVAGSKARITSYVSHGLLARGEFVIVPTRESVEALFDLHRALADLVCYWATARLVHQGDDELDEETTFKITRRGRVEDAEDAVDALLDAYDDGSPTALKAIIDAACGPEAAPAHTAPVVDVHAPVMPAPSAGGTPAPHPTTPAGESPSLADELNAVADPATRRPNNSETQTLPPVRTAQSAPIDPMAGQRRAAAEQAQAQQAAQVQQQAAQAQQVLIQQAVAQALADERRQQAEQAAQAQAEQAAQAQAKQAAQAQADAKAKAATASADEDWDPAVLNQQLAAEQAAVNQAITRTVMANDVSLSYSPGDINAIIGSVATILIDPRTLAGKTTPQVGRQITSLLEAANAKYAALINTDISRLRTRFAQAAEALAQDAIARVAIGERITTDGMCVNQEVYDKAQAIEHDHQADLESVSDIVEQHAAQLREAYTQAREQAANQAAETARAEYDRINTISLDERISRLGPELEAAAIDRRDRRMQDLKAERQRTAEAHFQAGMGNIISHFSTIRSEQAKAEGQYAADLMAQINAYILSMKPNQDVERRMLDADQRFAHEQAANEARRKELKAAYEDRLTSLSDAIEEQKAQWARQAAAVDRAANDKYEALKTRYDESERARAEAEDRAKTAERAVVDAKAEAADRYNAKIADVEARQARERPTMVRLTALVATATLLFGSLSGFGIAQLIKSGHETGPITVQVAPKQGQSDAPSDKE